jgi:hypothetical protein
VSLGWMSGSGLSWRDVSKFKVWDAPSDTLVSLGWMSGSGLRGGVKVLGAVDLIVSVS